MKLFVIGTRGIPEIPGGIEKHCQELYPRIAAKGHTVFLCRRKPYVPKNNAELKHYKGVQLIDCYSPRQKSLEAICHTFLSVLIARIFSPDIIHFHGVGPSLLVPLARLLGLKVVTTNHGPDYDRKKWGLFAKRILLLGEYFGGRYANKMIAISSVIDQIIRKRCKIVPAIIPNGVSFSEKTENSQLIEKMGIKAGKYILTVARMVPEKGLHDLIKAYKEIDTEYQLVIAGDADHESAYSRELKISARSDPRIILTGYITGPLLSAIYSNARIFVLPSYHEGHPIALLEALSYGLQVLVSDIPANIEIGLHPDNYFQCGNISSIIEGLKLALERPFGDSERSDLKSFVHQKYDWEKIADQTIEIYKEACINL